MAVVQSAGCAKAAALPGCPYHRSMLRNVSSVRIKDLASVQYVGLAGISASCHDAVKRLVQFGDRIERARLLTCQGQHALLLTLEPEELIVVKSGFSSGYGGEGPRTLAEVLRLLDALSVEIEECEVSEIVLEHVDASALTVKDLEAIQSAPPVRPRRWHDYIYHVLGPTEDRLPVWGNFRPVMPWAIIDRRIIDLALQFSDRPDDSILKGFRRLEDCIRTRTGLDEHGARLFANAFTGEDAKLEWDVKDKAEQTGRAQLFSAAFMAYRNPRAHRELDHDYVSLHTEFLMLNHLFALERQAVHRTAPP